LLFLPSWQFLKVRLRATEYGWPEFFALKPPSVSNTRFSTSVP
jgi:hypothetical protein